MQLNSILHLTGELLQGSDESPSDESADTDALLPFAAVLSGAFSLVDPMASDGEAPDSESPLLASGEGTDVPASAPPLLWIPGLEEIHLAEIADPAVSATPPLAEEALTEAVVLDQSTMPDGEISQSTPPEPDVAQGDDAASQAVAEEASVMPVEEDAPPDQESKIKTEGAPLLTEDEAPSEPACDAASSPARDTTSSKETAGSESESLNKEG